MKNYQTTGKILGHNITSNNFFRKHIDMIVGRARTEQKQLQRFRYLKKRLKLRLYKSLILPILLYPIIPLNTCSKAQMNRLQTRQNEVIRWICNERYPLRCPIDLRHQQLKLEYISDRIRRMAENIWSNLEEETSDFFNKTITINITQPHNHYPSSYNIAFQ